MTPRMKSALALLLCWAATQAGAQNFPTQPVKLIVPFAPGGNVDVTARIISIELGKILGQSVIVENRAGGGGSIGATAVATATPDGHTLLMGASGPLSVNPVAIPNLAYDPVKDFAPVSRIHVVPLVVLTNPKSGIGSIKDLMARAKAEPGKITIASAGVGTMNHLAIELFNHTAGVELLHVPYKGGGPALNDLLGGQVSLAFEQMNSSMGFIKDGRLTPLAVSSRKRSSALPNVPTLDELGLQGYEAATFVGVLAPARTPKAVIDKLNAAVRRTMESPEVLARLRDLGAEPAASSPEEFGALVRSELDKWRGLATRAGIKFE